MCISYFFYFKATRLLSLLKKADRLLEPNLKVTISFNVHKWSCTCSHLHKINGELTVSS